MINGKGSEHLALGGKYRRGPAGAETEGSSLSFERRPTRIRLNIRHNNALPMIGRGSTRTDPRTNWECADEPGPAGGSAAAGRGNEVFAVLADQKNCRDQGTF